VGARCDTQRDGWPLIQASEDELSRFRRCRWEARCWFFSLSTPDAAFEYVLERLRTVKEDQRRSSNSRKGIP
jgi:hypothetical protein